MAANIHDVINENWVLATENLGFTDLYHSLNKKKKNKTHLPANNQNTPIWSMKQTDANS